MSLKIYHKSFSELSTNELYDIMALRQIVFVVEQDCPYLDADGKDLVSHHVLAYDSSGLLGAYARIVPPDTSYKDYSSIGRVVSSQASRGKGIGKQLMSQTIMLTKELYPDNHIKISAQVYILEFYRNLGFVEQGKVYMEDDIPHQAMTLST